ncbi:MAG: DUF4956 domain-containing protein [Candidatus Kapaibacteriales bacterium]
MFEDFNNIDVFAVTPQQLLASLMIALACGLAMAFIYRMSYRGTGYSAPFADSIVLLTMVTALVITVIGDNLARAFGLVGAMSIIRFRTALRDTTDIVFIFFALAVGMASGTGLYKLAGTATVVIGGVAFILSRGNFSKLARRHYIFHIRGVASPNEIEEFLKGKISSTSLISYRKNEGISDIFMQIKPKTGSDIYKLGDELENLPKVSSMEIFFEDSMDASLRD